MSVGRRARRMAARDARKHLSSVATTTFETLSDPLRELLCDTVMVIELRRDPDLVAIVDVDNARVAIAPVSTAPECVFGLAMRQVAAIAEHGAPGVEPGTGVVLVGRATFACAVVSGAMSLFGRQVLAGAA